MFLYSCVIVSVFYSLVWSLAHRLCSGSNVRVQFVCQSAVDMLQTHGTNMQTRADPKVAHHRQTHSNINYYVKSFIAWALKTSLQDK